jgi:two-component system C4-dicarboxylate transport response regulator DctD
MAEVRQNNERDRGAPRVLLVEDEPGAREAIAEALGGAGLGVVAGTAASAEAALGTAATDPAGPPPAALVTDTDLASGGMDGLALAAEARRRWPNLGVVYVTGRPSKLHGRALRGRDRFLPKPVMPGAVVRAVRGLVGATSDRAP